MKIALIGPTHPYKGGIAHHTTELAHRLEAAGNDVKLISWSAQYPAVLYPGVQRVSDDEPEMPPFGKTSYPLSWKNPLGWSRVGRELRDFDTIVLVFVTSIQAPAYLTMLKSLGQKRKGKIVALCHNVLPHERRFFDLPLTRAVLGKVDEVLVHTPAQAEVAAGLTPAKVITAEMPPHLPSKPITKPVHDPKNLQKHLLFFGLVRKYKGVDVLIRALAKANVPDVKLTIAGEIWGGIEGYQQLIDECGLQGRVLLQSGYVPSKQIPGLFASSDALVLPYRSGTATQNVFLAHTHGIPVIATSVGSMGQQVHDGVDGLVCKPDDVNDLARAISTFYSAGTAQKLYANLPDTAADEDRAWNNYLSTFI